MDSDRKEIDVTDQAGVPEDLWAESDRKPWDGAGRIQFTAVVLVVVTGVVLLSITDASRDGPVGLEGRGLVAVLAGLWVLAVVLSGRSWWTGRRGALTRIWTEPTHPDAVLARRADDRVLLLSRRSITRVLITCRYGDGYSVVDMRLSAGRRRYRTHSEWGADYSALAGGMRGAFPNAEVRVRMISPGSDSAS